MRSPISFVIDHDFRWKNAKTRTSTSWPGTWTFIPHRPVCLFVGRIQFEWTGWEKKLTSDQIHWNQHCTQRCQLGKDIVNLVVRVRHLDGDLREVVGV